MEARLIQESGQVTEDKMNPNFVQPAESQGDCYDSITAPRRIRELEDEHNVLYKEIATLRADASKAITLLEEALGEYHDTAQIKAAIALLEPQPAPVATQEEK